ncbi:hypothetical protein WJX84_003558 [Apatococcus fuscideae]|uniref:Uncharacterized protein n=1 Tax=Apatococcus fuscideae TaxID=2026836 RepID=A0AAW1SQP7_9CHLO
MVFWRKREPVESKLALPNGSLLNQALLRDRQGNFHTAQSLWKDAPALVLVIRRPGCSLRPEDSGLSKSCSRLTEFRQSVCFMNGIQKK